MYTGKAKGISNRPNRSRQNAYSSDAKSVNTFMDLSSAARDSFYKVINNL